MNIIRRILFYIALLIFIPAIHEMLLVHKCFHTNTSAKPHILWDYCWQTSRKFLT